VILGIDAANLRVGGGVTHLVQLLRAAEPQAHGFTRVIVWGGSRTLARIDERPWLHKSPVALLDRALPFRAFWQRFRLAPLARAAGCSLLFAPGGSASDAFHPVITMSRNLLPFEWHELRRYGWSWLTMKWLLLRAVQGRAFRRADGLIFLTRYAREVVSQVVPLRAARLAIISHGVERRFLQSPRAQQDIAAYSSTRPFRIVYVSIVDLYKHQWRVAEVVARLRAAGLPVELELIGPAYPPALARLDRVRRQFDPRGEFLFYRGKVPNEQLPDCYAAADLCVFASSCENMPNILLEAMASGLPIACSNRGPMPEVLGESGVFFDPEDSADITRALRVLLSSAPLRAQLAAASHARVQGFSWQRCAQETFAFLAAMAREPSRNTVRSTLSSRSPGELR
jgi:glycosyltransferase involved in cell wall biosynthesis